MLVKFEKKKYVVHYVGKVISKYGFSEFEISYLRKKPTSWVFVFPNVEDKSSVDISDMTFKLPKPRITKGTRRTASLFGFLFDFSSYYVL